MAEDVYYDRSVPELMAGSNYRRIQGLELESSFPGLEALFNGDTGYAGAVYVSENRNGPKSYVLANRGLELESTTEAMRLDTIAVAANLFDYENPQASVAINAARLVRRSIESDASLMFVGQSLGGLLADIQYGAVRGTRSITFNALPGPGPIQRAALSKLGVSFADTKGILNYGIKGEITEFIQRNPLLNLFIAANSAPWTRFRGGVLLNLLGHPVVPAGPGVALIPELPGGYTPMPNVPATGVVDKLVGHHMTDALLDSFRELVKPKFRHTPI
jgi:hypothetical protein